MLRPMGHRHTSTDAVTATDERRDVARVGIVGAGQLARMTVQAAIGLAVPIRLLADRATDSAALVSPDVRLGAPDDPAALAALAAGCDVVTFDHELVDAEILARLEAAGHTVRPGAGVVALVQDKRRQRAALAAAGCPNPAWQALDGADPERDLVAFGEAHGWPVVAKAARGGYDGRGVWVLGDPDAARALLAGPIGAGTPLMAEAFVPIAREIAVVVARRPGGEVVAYPAVETVQVDGICRELRIPAPLSPSLVVEAERLALSVAEAIGVVGLLAVELFVTHGDAAGEGGEDGGRLVVNELASRPHNSGHWTIEGARTSQFAQHLRAVLDWPLGPTAPTAPAVVTVNVLGAAGASGDPAARVGAALAVPGVQVHLYGKAARPGRKLGHVTALGDDPDEVADRARRAAAVLAGE